MKNQFYSTSLLIGALFFSLIAKVLAVPLSDTERQNYQFVGTKELKEWIQQKKNMTVIDVRASYAYQMEHIPGSISIPLSDFKNAVVKNPLSRNGRIVTYCSCPRHEAEMAYDILKPMEYHNVYVLQDGLPGWKRTGYKTVGELANQPMTPYWVIGYVTGDKGKSKPDIPVRVLQPSTQQLEIGATDKSGFYSLQLLFYGLKPGDEMQVIVGSDVIFYYLENKTKPWGTRVDDKDGRMILLPDDFAKTFKQKKLHAY